MDNKNSVASLITQLAVLNETVDNLKDKQRQEVIDIEEKQKENHENIKKIHNDMSLLRLDISRLSEHFSFVIKEQQDIKEVIKNNTSALKATEIMNIKRDELLNRLLVERETTKSIFTTLGKIILWVGSIPTLIYTLYNLLKAFKS